MKLARITGRVPRSSLKQKTQYENEAHQEGRKIRENRQGEALVMDLVFSGTIELAAAIRAGQVSATEVLEAHLAQIERHNPALNAIVIIGRRRRPCTGARGR